MIVDDRIRKPTLKKSPMNQMNQAFYARLIICVIHSTMAINCITKSVDKNIIHWRR